MTTSQYNELAPTPEEIIQIDIEDISTRLGLGLDLLHLQRNQAADRLNILINYSIDPLIVDTDAATGIATESIFETLDDVAREEKRDFAKLVHGHYPEQFDADDVIVSPRQFQKTHTLDGNMRVHLKDAYSDHLSASKASLLDAVQATRPREVVAVDIAEVQVEDCVVDLAKDLQLQIEGAVTRLEALMPRLTDRTHMFKQAARLAIGRAAKVIAVENLDVDPEQLNTALDTLSELLIFARGGSDILGKAASDYFKHDAAEATKEQLADHFTALAKKAAAGLAVSINEAYEDVRARRPVHQPAFAELKLEAVDTDEATPDTEEESDTSANVEMRTDNVEEMSLGLIESPFPWLKDEKIEPIVVSKNGQSLIFIDGMWSAAKTLSENLRTTSEVGKKFPQVQQRIQEIVLSNADHQNPRIRPAGKRGRGFHGLTVCYYTDSRPNAGQTYYTKTSVGQYPELAELAAEAGLAANTPVVILLAETDINHQATVLRFLGAKK